MRRLADLINASGPEKLSESSGIALRRLGELAGGAEASMSEVRAVASALRVDPAELLETPRQGQVDFLFRETAARSNPTAISKLSNRIAWSLDLLPDRDEGGPSWIGEFDRRTDDFETASRNAEKFRRLFFEDDHISPFLHLPSLASNHLGILLFLLRIKGIDGASAIFGGVPFIFLAEQFRPRMLFTLAHEIGHLICHHRGDQAFAVVDLSAERPRKRKNVIESYAHAFASALLMPSRGVAIALEQIRGLGQRGGQPIGDIELLLLSRIFGVSFYAAARRCEDLDLLPRGGAASLDHAIRRSFGSPEKRAEALDLPPRPEIRFPRVPEPLLASTIDRIRAGEVSIGRASEALGFSISDLVDANAPEVH